MNEMNRKYFKKVVDGMFALLATVLLYSYYLYIDYLFFSC